MLSDYLNSKPPKYKVGNLYYGEKKMIGVVKSVETFSYVHHYRVMVVCRGDSDYLLDQIILTSSPSHENVGE